MPEALGSIHSTIGRRERGLEGERGKTREREEGSKG
jgi:hypothetical protein